ncbi:MAG: alanine--tRNA ligase [Methanomassiliicoccales archaeon]
MLSSEFDLDFFGQNDFYRRRCPKCGRHFWTQGEWGTCGEPPCEEYTFIGNSPMKRSLGPHETREAFLGFFEENGHGIVDRYPIVARWRDDVFFTQASIYDFQPWVINGVEEPPFNPLAISQTCVRFNDIDNVGKTGRHMTFFEMLAHHAFNTPGEQVYFKDRTVELCHQFFSSTMGADPRRLRYVEAWWEGGGNSGPCLEVILDGAELATLVFMMYRETSQGRVPLNMKVVDTGYGLERISWVSQGSSSAYEAVFGPVLKNLKSELGLETETRVLMEYSKVAGMTDAKTAADVRRIREETAQRIGIPFQELMDLVRPLEEVYVVCDHSRALSFLLNDGVVPSNVREGYFARLLVRRALRSLRALELDLPLSQVVNWQIDYFAPHFPELDLHREDITDLVEVEEARYQETLSRGRQLVERITQDMGPDEKISGEKLIELYDSHGLNPEIVQEFSSLEVEIPDDFYIQVAARHEEVEEEDSSDLPEDLPSTRMLFHEDPELVEFDAEVMEVVDSAVVLDQTAFYPEGGGQEWDLGDLSGQRVTRVVRSGNSVLHYLDGEPPGKGTTVVGRLDRRRRLQLMRHHTAAHIINGKARELLGNHVWQAGAHKSVDVGRLDITHYRNLDQGEMERLERLANTVVLDDFPVHVSMMPRDQAEQRYGHRLYQGGAVPGKNIRVVDIPGIDAEACGGIHCTRTSLVGPIRIHHTRRIQDGVVRIEFSAGEAALDMMARDRSVVHRLSEALNVPVEEIPPAVEGMREENRVLRKRVEEMDRRLSSDLAQTLLERAEELDGLRLITYLDEGETDLAELSKTLAREEKVLAVLGQANSKGRIMVTRGQGVEVDCRSLLEEISSRFGGGGGGKAHFAQGGGDPRKVREAFEHMGEIVRSFLGTRRE